MTGKKIFLTIFLTILMTSLSLSFTGCSHKITVYEFQLQQDLLEKAEESGIAGKKSELFESEAFEIYCSKNFIIILHSMPLDPIKETETVNLGQISSSESYNKIPQSEYGSITFEMNRQLIFPCIEFTEDLPCSSFPFESFSEDLLNAAQNSAEQMPETQEESDAAEEVKIQLNYFEDIPEGFIALPVELNEMQYYPDNENYPLYKSTYCTLTFSRNDGTQEEPDTKQEQFNEAQKILTIFFNTELMPALKTQTEFPELLKICSCGDMMLARGVENEMIKAKAPYPVFKDTLTVLQLCDFTIGNLEGVVTSRNLKTPKTYNFKFQEKALDYLKQAGFDYLMLTNNHSYDYGEEGFIDTLKAVKNKKFATSGAGMNETEAKQFYRTQIKDYKISVLSAGAYPLERSGFNGRTMATATETRAGILWQSDEILEMVKAEKKISDIVIVNVHGGAEYVTVPTEAQKKFYTALCDNGADIVFGTHPHVLQPVELYNSSLIVWSLGNFIFPGMEEMPGATDSMIVQAGFCKNRLLYYRKYPAQIQDKSVVLK